MKQFFNTLAHKILWMITCIFFWRVREIEINGEPYLRRLYVFKRKGWLFNFPFAVYLHYFHKGDSERLLHNHPWNKAKSLILTGGYTEYKREFCLDPQDSITKSTVVVNLFNRGDVNKLSSDDYHKILLRPEHYGKHTWTLFITGDRLEDYEERYDDWTFWDPITDKYIPHFEFKNMKS